MKIEISKKLKRRLYLLLMVAAVFVGIYLEMFQSEPFRITTPPPEIPKSDMAVEDAVDDDKLNINTATMGELVAIKGIGEATAKKIIDFRDKNGKFEAIEELTLVKGISEKMLEELRSEICVR